MEGLVMKKLGIIAFILVFFTSCNSQTKVSHKDPKNKTVVTASNNGKNPDIKIKVKKTYDKNGKMVGYDSTYYYSYVNSKGNLKEYNADSLISEFRKSVPKNLSKQFGMNEFNGFFNTNPHFYHNFLNNKFFSEEFNNERQHFEKLVESMDSLKNSFFNSAMPDFVPGKNQNQHSKTKK